MIIIRFIGALKKSLVFALIFTPLFFIGCGGAYRSTRLSLPVLEEYERVIYRNIDMKASVGVIDLQSDRVNNLLRVRARFKNLVSWRINLEIMVRFLDADGFDLVSQPAWFPLTMLSGQIQTFERISSDLKAVDFRIVLRRAGN